MNQFVRSLSDLRSEPRLGTRAKELKCLLEYMLRRVSGATDVDLGQLVGEKQSWFSDWENVRRAIAIRNDLEHEPDNAALQRVRLAIRDLERGITDLLPRCDPALRAFVEGDTMYTPPTDVPAHSQSSVLQDETAPRTKAAMVAASGFVLFVLGGWMGSGFSATLGGVVAGTAGAIGLGLMVTGAVLGTQSTLRRQRRAEERFEKKQRAEIRQTERLIGPEASAELRRGLLAQGMGNLIPDSLFSQNVGARADDHAAAKRSLYWSIPLGVLMVCIGAMVLSDKLNQLRGNERLAQSSRNWMPEKDKHIFEDGHREGVSGITFGGWMLAAGVGLPITVWYRRRSSQQP